MIYKWRPHSNPGFALKNKIRRNLFPNLKAKLSDPGPAHKGVHLTDDFVFEIVELVQPGRIHHRYGEHPIAIPRRSGIGGKRVADNSGPSLLEFISRKAVGKRRLAIFKKALYDISRI